MSIIWGVHGLEIYKKEVLCNYFGRTQSFFFLLLAWRSKKMTFLNWASQIGPQKVFASLCLAWTILLSHSDTADLRDLVVVVVESCILFAGASVEILKKKILYLTSWNYRYFPDLQDILLARFVITSLIWKSFVFSADLKETYISSCWRLRSISGQAQKKKLFKMSQSDKNLWLLLNLRLVLLMKWRVIA